MLGRYKVEVNNILIDIDVIEYSPLVKGNYTAPNEESYPDDPEYIEWVANTGIPLLDNYINYDELNSLSIEEQLLEQIHNKIEVRRNYSHGII